jgi:predicted ferric reductase
MPDEAAPANPESPPSLPSLSWQHERGWATCAAGLYILAAGAPLLVSLLTLSAETDRVVFVARQAGLMGCALLALQVVLSARLKPLDRPFGLDCVMRVHKTAAIVATVLLLAHPILLVAGYGNAFILGFEVPWYINLGKITLLLVIGVVLAAMFFKEFGIEYQVWRVAHKGAIAVVVLGFTHALFAGSDLQASGLRVYWFVLGIAAVGLFLWRNVYVPFWGRRRFRVTDVTPAVHNTFTISLEPEDGQSFEHQPGQFMFLKLHRPGRPSEEHPFTIASSPTGEPPLQATIKQSGDYTNTIDQTRPGDRAHIEAPFGRFSFAFHQAESFLFIAGGVGITPIMSMLRALADTGDDRPALLIYGNRTERDIIFREELDALTGNVTVAHVLSEPDENWGGLAGYVTKEIIQEQAGELLDRADVFLCGPPPMMDKVVAALRGLGVPRGRIHFERFAL